MKPSAQSFLRYPLDRIFESPANVRVLRALVRHGGAMTTSMVMVQTGLTRVSVLAAIERLAEAGMADVMGSERQRLNRFNLNNPLAAAVNDLFSAESARYSGTIHSIREISERLGAAAVWIFGSVARGEDRPNSDIDIAVAVDPQMENALGDALRALENVNASVVVVNPPLIARLEREQDPWWLALKRDAITVMGIAPENYLAWARRREAKGDDADRKRKKSRS
jgi:predicted nucleotidyltransferase/DNA-binding transcriptional ArsR family regulator